MKGVNKIAKLFFYITLTLFMIMQSYVIGLFIGGAVLSLVLAVWSVFTYIPSYINDNYWLIYLVSGAPIGLYVLIYLIVSTHKNQKNKTKGKE
jgi:hypothetical protein